MAWALLEVHQEWDDGELLLEARTNLMWAMAQQLENGRSRNNAISVAEYPSLHTIAYAERGPLEARKILQDQQNIQAEAKAEDALLVRQQNDGPQLAGHVSLAMLRHLRRGDDTLFHFHSSVEELVSLQDMVARRGTVRTISSTPQRLELLYNPRR